jgi:HYR domain
VSRAVILVLVLLTGVALLTATASDARVLYRATASRDKRLLIAPGERSHLTRRTTNTLAIDVRFPIKWAPADCPHGSPTTTYCYTATGHPAIPGLGQAELELFLAVDRSDPAYVCEKWAENGSVAVGSRGSISFAASSAGCIYWHSAVGKNLLSITGGSEELADAAGSGVLDFSGFRESTFSGSVHLTGSLSAPHYTFDTTPPTLSGVRNIVVRAKTKRGARVRFAITATDDVDGSLSAGCTPSSGNLFRPGVTRVTCSASDTSANTAQGRFTVTVKRRSR